jgi:uncharacterized protein YjfI (DUF2170 family)
MPSHNQEVPYMNWTTETLTNLLSSNTEFNVKQNGEVVEATNEEGILIIITVCGEQIVARSLLFPYAQIKDHASFNETLLRTQHMFPLASVHITTIDGDDYYESVGELSSESNAETIQIEIDTLFDTTEGMLVTYEENLLESV